MAKAKPMAGYQPAAPSAVEVSIHEALMTYVYDTPDAIAIKAWILSHFVGAVMWEQAQRDADFVDEMMAAVRYGGMDIGVAAREIANCAATPCER